MSAQASPALHALGPRSPATGFGTNFRETGRDAATRRLAALSVGLGLALAVVLAPPAALAADYNPRGHASATTDQRAHTQMQHGGAVIRINDHEGTRTRRIPLSIGKSIIIDLPRDAKEVFVANPAIANAIVRSTRKIFLIGQADGATSVFVFGEDGRQLATLEVTVGRDLGDLRDTLRHSFPRTSIDVQPAGDSIILTGKVNSASEAQKAVDIAEAFVGAGNGDLSGRGAVINSLTIEEQDQVMLRVAVVEISRTVLKQLGIQTNAGWSTSANPLPSNLRFNTTGGGTTLSGGFGGSGFDVNVTLNAMENAGLSRTLAEPTLVTVSGEGASFMAGGEIPILQPCAPGATNCVPSVSFKPFGINLAFTPVVLSENRISLRVATEVSELDFETGARVGNGTIPGMRVRKSETSVELPSGAVMMTAGLISSQTIQGIGGTPGLMNIPILGALFRSRDYQRRETELMIMVTPYIAQPMQPSEAARPDDGFVEAFDPQAVLLGRLNQIYGTAGASNPERGVRGRFGFIAD